VLHCDPQGTLASQALLCTDPDLPAAQIVSWFVLRWQLEVIYHEIRARLGVETQRQWSDLAVQVTSPVLLDLFSFVTLLAHDPNSSAPQSVQRAAGLLSRARAPAAPATRNRR
jgi:hypothetical protein